MYKALVYRVVFAIFGMLVVGTPCARAESQPPKPFMDYPEWDLLPKGIDFDESDMVAIQKLLDEGPAAYEAMLAVVKECDNSMMVSHALAILRESPGEKGEVVVELKRIFAQRLPRAVGDETWIVDYIAAAIADIGTEDDTISLIPLLEHPNLRLRVMGARYLGQSGGQEALTALEQARSRNSNQRVQQEIFKAIDNIEKRLAAQNAGRNPAP